MTIKRAAMRPTPLRALSQLVAVSQPKASPLFTKLATALDGVGTGSRSVKQAILAQWALESNWGRSELARVHYNFAGITWDEQLDDLAGKIVYMNKGAYCRFDDLNRFLEAYWRRLKGAGINNLQSTPDAHAFIAGIAPAWHQNAPQYAAKISSVVAHLEKADVDRPVVPIDPTPSALSSPDVASPGNIPASDRTLPSGFVIRVKREKTERRAYGRHRTRTLGAYDAFFNGQKIPGLEGSIYEQKGPGDNTPSGKPPNSRRIEAKTYPLFTHGHDGSKYKTHGYTSSTRAHARSAPAVKVGGTGARTAILMHPASGFLGSIGCLNFSKPLAGARKPMQWGDSRARAISFIDSLKNHLGGKFPNTNGKRIPDTWLVVEGEPGGTRRSILETATRRTSNRVEIDRELSTDRIRKLLSNDVFDVLADTINGEVLPEHVNPELFERILKERGFIGGGWFSPAREVLSKLRGERGETLWEAWANGWQRSSELADADERERVQSELKKVAGILKTLDVGVNLPGLFQTPLTAFAAHGAAAAVKALVKVGADEEQHDPQGNTTLISAAFSAATGVVGVLLGGGVNRGVTAHSESEVSSSRRGVGDANEDPELYAEQPPRGKTALEAARVGKQMLGDPSELAAQFDEIISQLSN